MSFATDDSVWDQFLATWPLERLRNMTLAKYTKAGDKETFTYWLEARLDQYGSIWGGSAFKFAIYSRGDSEHKQGDSALAYTDQYGWYRRFGDTPQTAFEAIRKQVVAVAEAARSGKLEEVDQSELGPAYRWKIAFHYQDRSNPNITCVFTRAPFLHFLHSPMGDKSTMHELQQRVMARRHADVPVVAFGADVWRQWATSHPLQVKLTKGAIKNGYVTFSLLSAPFPDAMHGDPSGNAPGETARFTLDNGEQFVADIRASGSGGRLRHRLGGYFKDAGLEAGDVIEVAPDDAGGYVITRVPSGKASATKPASAIPTLPSVNERASTYSMKPVNKILFGPPGTGKTFRTVNEALAVVDPGFLGAHVDDRAQLKWQFDALVNARRIRFVTFHQSFSYEDFVEGIRADSEGGVLQYRVEPGVFRTLCEDAGGSAQVAEDVGVREGARIWKISIDGTASPSPTRDYCFAHSEARIGWPAVGDLIADGLPEKPAYVALGTNDRNTLHAFSREIEPGDVLLCIGSDKTAQAIGVVQGSYEYQSEPPKTVRNDYVNVLPVKWLATGLSLDIRRINDGRKFTLKTVYELTRFGWSELSDYLDNASVRLAGATPGARSKALPYVLIIDEINRGNISRIFGELITLIEPSKRKGEAEALEVVLPYSKKRFSVPANVHLIGTMNTADRSLAGLDVALRRRFDFVEVLPEPSTLAGVEVEGVPMDELLAVMNQRIEVLMGRDYMLGHAYFLGLIQTPSIAALAAVFRNKVMPLLQEYFFEDWQKIAWVLNDHRKSEALRFVQQSDAHAINLFGADVDLPHEVQVWHLNAEAFDNPAAYRAIIAAPQVGT